mgnify:CR=1 FL=1
MSGKEIIEKLKIVYKDKSPSKSFVYKWIAEFKRGRENVLNECSEDRPVEIGDSKEKEIESIVRYKRKQ